MGQKRGQIFSSVVVNIVLLLLVLLWTIPTFGLLVSSFRTRQAIQTSGWWSIFPHRTWVRTDEPVADVAIPDDRDGVMEILGATGTFEEFREGVISEDGTQRIIWVGNKRLPKIYVEEYTWAPMPEFTLGNYQNVLGGKEYVSIDSEGREITEQGAGMGESFLNSVTVTIPATIIPILIAAFAGYGFAWMKFPGRRALFIMVVALLVVPLQIALIPILRDYVALDLNGTFLAIWLAHTGFGLPLATYLLYNYISSLPREILESAFIDGASHFTIFIRLILPLSVPALASFAIFQFLWVWNDYLVALIFLGFDSQIQVMTMRLAEMVGTRGSDWHVLTAGAFTSMILPLVVFFSMQRYFVRGLLAGSVKG